MTSSFASSLDALSGWRAALARRIDDLSRHLADHPLADATALDQLAALRGRIGNEKMIVAFVAEFSRGKSELINAIFFADTGRRVLPATPGRTTMCPVELGWDDDEPPSLRLLPIDSRLGGASLAELRAQRHAWQATPLQIDDPDRLAEVLEAVTRKRWVDQALARDLGFWNDAQPQDNPPVDADGRVEVPAWRHALINYPHPLLRQGLVVLDTPGLNAIGAEPELTLGLLPTAHATVFILAADAGVTRSDLDIWRDHLGSRATSRFVVLNKIDALADPLATVDRIVAQIEGQCVDTAATLGIDRERVFPLSARQALAARIGGDEAALEASRLPALEAALVAQLLPQRRRVLEQAVAESARQLEHRLDRMFGDQRRQLAEQMVELRELRGKSSGRLRLMIERVDVETGEFEQCVVRLQALRVVHGRMLRDALGLLSTERLTEEVAQMQAQMSASLLNLGARKSFVGLCARLRALLEQSHQRNHEIRGMLGASFGKLNSEFGFSLALNSAPDMAQYANALVEIEKGYVRYLGPSQALRLSSTSFMTQFRRMLMSKLNLVFESASSELELWNRATSSQIDMQLRERRRNFRRRRDSLERVQNASSDLEMRLAEIEAGDARLQAVQTKTGGLFRALREQVAAVGDVAANASLSGSTSGSAAVHLLPAAEASDDQRLRVTA